MPLLNENEIHQKLESLSNWIYSNKQISKEFKLNRLQRCACIRK